jgi:hypothetical protein
MRISNEAFISYAHLDNEPLTKAQEGWISRFKDSLETLVSMRLGRPARIWKDDRLRGNDMFANEIVSQFPETALLVSVLTPRYVESEWCVREAQAFCKAADATGGVVMANKSRIFKVIKTPVDDEASLPPVMQETLGYEFFVVGEEGTPLELDPSYGVELAQKYLMKVTVLAQQIADLIKKIELESGGMSEPLHDSKPVVYLAEASWDQQGAREALQAELHSMGYTVVPDRGLPDGEIEYRKAVEELLEKCDFSIHLVGNTYGGVPNGPTQESKGVIQNELAVEQSKKRGLKRVIWLPRGTHSDQGEQQEFINDLHRVAEMQRGADLLTGDIEHLKSAILGNLNDLEEVSVPEVSSVDADRQPMIYLICDERDRKDVMPLRKFLRQAGFEVKIPVFEGDAATVRKSNEERLAECDSVILFYGIGDEGWKSTVDSELKKIKVFRKESDAPPIYSYLAEPTTEDKSELIELEEPNVIDGLNGFVEAGMAEFLGEFADRNTSRSASAGQDQ